VGAETYEQVKHYHKGWVEESLGDGNIIRDDRWTKCIAAGSKAFVESVKTDLRALARVRKVRKAAEAYQLRAPSAFYGGDLGGKNECIGPENIYYWNVYDE